MFGQYSASSTSLQWLFCTFGACLTPAVAVRLFRRYAAWLANAVSAVGYHHLTTLLVLSRLFWLLPLFFVQHGGGMIFLVLFWYPDSSQVHANRSLLYLLLLPLLLCCSAARLYGVALLPPTHWALNINVSDVFQLYGKHATRHVSAQKGSASAERRRRQRSFTPRHASTRGRRGGATTKVGGSVKTFFEPPRSTELWESKRLALLSTCGSGLLLQEVAGRGARGLWV